MSTDDPNALNTPEDAADVAAAGEKSAPDLAGPECHPKFHVARNAIQKVLGVDRGLATNIALELTVDEIRTLVDEKTEAVAAAAIIKKQAAKEKFASLIPKPADSSPKTGGETSGSNDSGVDDVATTNPGG